MKAFCLTLLTLLAQLAAAADPLRSDPIETCLGKFEIIEATHNDDGSLTGNSGRLWDITIGGSRIGQLWGHHLAMRLEDDPGRHQVRVWAYLRHGGRSGRLGYYVITEHAIAPFSSIDIFPGDDGTDLDNAMYQAVFQDSISFQRGSQQDKAPDAAHAGDP